MWAIDTTTKRQARETLVHSEGARMLGRSVIDKLQLLSCLYCISAALNCSLYIRISFAHEFPEEPIGSLVPCYLLAKPLTNMFLIK